MRFTEGSQFSMNVKDEHKTSKVWFIKCPWHKISRYKRPAELATAKYAHAHGVQFILVSHWGLRSSHKLHEASFHCYITSVCRKMSKLRQLNKHFMNKWMNLFMSFLWNLFPSSIYPTFSSGSFKSLISSPKSLVFPLLSTWNLV